MAICACCEDFDGGHTRKTIFAYLCGALIAIGWWLFIDGAVMGPRTDADWGITTGNSTVQWAYYFPGVIGNVAGIFFCSLNMNNVNGDSSDSDCVKMFTKVLYFSLLAIIFAAPLFSIWILITYAIGAKFVWPGIAILLQNLLIMAGSLTFRFVCVPE
ncbi:hypothetical protein PAPYR_5574 [Paratrimastix pyriformis]|uniref:Uncharacterized protein n=1 Tax=Paratrimastix pyriformis TaxID=342808 RepID=A0ABQ8UHA4_9EUKA|nr:hypothetical protein PAPYR_5574 [Paratrimastix pyriformis]